MGIRSMMRDQAVAVACRAARLYLNHAVLRGIGTLSRLRVDTRQRTALGTLALVDENEPLTVSVGAYEFFRAGDGCGVVLKDLAASRRWITAALAKAYPEGIPISLDEGTFALLRKAL